MTWRHLIDIGTDMTWFDPAQLDPSTLFLLEEVLNADEQPRMSLISRNKNRRYDRTDTSVVSVVFLWWCSKGLLFSCLFVHTVKRSSKSPRSFKSPSMSFARLSVRAPPPRLVWAPGALTRALFVTFPEGSCNYVRKCWLIRSFTIKFMF